MSALTDLEYRVWTDYELVADDFGVMPYSPAMVRAGNPSLAARPEPVIQEALDNIVKAGLAIRFEHQGQPFICDPTWQNFQKIERPRRTYYPVPARAALERCSDATVYLFARYHPAASAFPFPEFFRNARRKVAKYSDASRTQGRRQKPIDSRLTANGKRQETLVVPGGGAGEGSTSPTGTFDTFWSVYPRKVGRGAAEEAWKRAVKKASPEVILAALKRQLPGLLEREPKYVPHAATWLNQQRWQDEPDRPELPPGLRGLARFAAKGESDDPS